MAGGVRPPLGARRHRVFRAVGGSYLARDYHLPVCATGGGDREAPVIRGMWNHHEGYTVGKCRRAMTLTPKRDGRESSRLIPLSAYRGSDWERLHRVRCCQR